MSEKFRFVQPDDDNPSDTELIMTSLSLLMTVEGQRSKDPDFKAAALVMSIRLHERCEQMRVDRNRPPVFKLGVLPPQRND